VLASGHGATIAAIGGFAGTDRVMLGTATIDFAKEW
jgi:hypothetical protein